MQHPEPRIGRSHIAAALCHRVPIRRCHHTFTIGLESGRLSRQTPLGRGPDAGAAYVLRYDGPTLGWVIEDTLHASDAGAGDEFGTGVAIHGDVAVVGAPRDDDVALEAGAAYVFRRSGSSWTEEAKLVAPPGSGALFDFAGRSVAVGADAILVGVEGDDGNGLGAAGLSTPSEISRSIVGQVLRDGRATWSDDARSDARFRASESVHLYALRSIGCLPVGERGVLVARIGEGQGGQSARRDQKNS